MLILVAPPRPPLKKKKKKVIRVSLGETKWKILEDILRKGPSHPLLVSLREESLSLMLPIRFHFSERGDSDKQG